MQGHVTIFDAYHFPSFVIIGIRACAQSVLWWKRFVFLTQLWIRFVIVCTEVGKAPEGPGLHQACQPCLLPISSQHGSLFNRLSLHPDLFPTPSTPFTSHTPPAILSSYGTLVLRSYSLPLSCLSFATMKWLLQCLSLAAVAVAQGAISTNTSSYNETEYGPNPVKLILSTVTNPGWVYDVVPLTDEAYLRLPVRYVSCQFKLRCLLTSICNSTTPTTRASSMVLPFSTHPETLTPLL